MRGTVPISRISYSALESRIPISDDSLQGHNILIGSQGGNRYPGSTRTIWLQIFHKHESVFFLLEYCRTYHNRWWVLMDRPGSGNHMFITRPAVPNSRAQIAVKSTKRMLLDTLTQNGCLDTDMFLKSILKYGNTSHCQDCFWSYFTKLYSSHAIQVQPFCWLVH